MQILDIVWCVTKKQPSLEISSQTQCMYPKYVYPRKFKNGENFIFKYMDKNKIAKSRKTVPIDYKTNTNSRKH